MTEAGLAKIEAAKRDGSWTRIAGAPPDDLAAANAAGEGTAVGAL